MWSGAVPEAVALRRYQAQRDRLSHGLFTATNRIAAYDWDQPSVQGLLREVSVCDERRDRAAAGAAAAAGRRTGVGVAVRLTRSSARR